MMRTFGHVNSKPSGHGYWESSNSHWLRVSHAHDLDLQEGRFGTQPITSLVDEKSTRDPKWQVHDIIHVLSTTPF
jgi:hypothetical protein